MGFWKDFYTALVDVSYQERILDEADLDEESFQETIETARYKLTLDKDEKIIYHDFALYAEPRSVRESVRGFTGLRLAKGLWVGGSRGRSESHQELRTMDYGTLTITNKKLIFMGKFKGQNFKLNQIAFVNIHTDGIQVGKSGKQHTMYFSAESGMLPYFAIKNIKVYNKLESLRQYIKFFKDLPSYFERTNLKGKQDNDILSEQGKKIELVAKEMEKRYSDFRSSEFSILNQDIENIIKSIRSMAKTLFFVLHECAKIAKPLPEPKGLAKIFGHSLTKQIAEKFKEKHHHTPKELTAIESEKVNKLISKFSSDIEIVSKKTFEKINPTAE